MLISTGSDGREQDIIDLFTKTFSASEGEDEGALIGGLVRDLLSYAPQEEIQIFCAEDNDQLVGSVAFSPLVYPDAPYTVLLLSPMAVAPDYQGKGIGQALIGNALAILGSRGIDIVITYGDPNFYGRVGFQQITEQQAQAPYPLTYPHGWLGQSLVSEGMPVLGSKPLCVPAFHREDVW